VKRLIPLGALPEFSKIVGYELWSRWESPVALSPPLIPASIRLLLVLLLKPETPVFMRGSA
tara:strand:- start:330 stop:512 length:183 start_codon:yes stop_codon:yes gene_type:complete